ncbi:peptidylprolyl isomerase [Stappia sp. F7233]|uniref:Parvulin-like PPIase n=1 Tax=Stappia albiluteola TaxID=2758565 RepID=A0A839AI01_9HYPH|nr:peptidylprolyl isomerase [Stappia albiluteola]MBA5778706.1 peptidylprolyl isomerase [Stappia albiluteola]
MIQLSFAAKSRARATGTLAAALVAAATLSASLSSVYAQEAGDVVARVGDSEVTEADLAFASQDFATQLQQLPPTQWRGVLTDIVVDMEVMANAAKAAGIDKEEDFQRQLDFLKLRALRNAYLVREVENKVTDADVKAAYDQEFENYSGEDEISASHILLKTKEEAEAAIKELEGGKDFAELAKEKSTGPSGPNGGSLGYFTRGQMVKPFEDAAFELEVGAITKQPVETQFGWHVIKVEDKRTQPAPELPAVSERIRQDLLRNRYAEVMEKLKAETKIEILEPAAEEQPQDGSEGGAQETPKN